MIKKICLYCGVVQFWKNVLPPRSYPVTCWHAGIYLGSFSAPEMELLHCCETSVDIQTTLHCIPEDGNFHNYSCLQPKVSEDILEGK
jgi:hypothetical protein